MNPLHPSNPAHTPHRGRQPGRLVAVFFLLFSLILTVRSSRGEEIGGPTRVADHYATASTESPAPGLIQDTLPATAFDMVGGQVTFTAVFSNSPAAVFQWQKISDGATNDLSGATNTTLTLANLQLTDAAAYRLKAVNATNRQAITYTSARPLVIDRLPAAVNNIVTLVAAQTGTGDEAFTPTWTVATNCSLIAGQPPSDSSGDFSKELSGRNVNSLTAGGSLELIITAMNVGDLSGNPITTGANYVTCGNSDRAGSSITYRLTGSDTGYDLTGITVYGGWADNGRDQQAYTVYFSTVLAPELFTPLSAVDYTPSDPAKAPSATRVTLKPINGTLARNVAAVKFDFTGTASKNGFCGYSQIILSGFRAESLPPPNSTNDQYFLTGVGNGSSLDNVDLLGSWIWDAKTFDAQTCQFWRAFDIPAHGKVTRARLFVTADNEFVFFLDGRELGRGDEWRILYDYNLTPLMSPGRHVLTVKAFNSVREAGLILGLRVDLADGRFIEIKSDQNWKIVPNDAKDWTEMTKAQADWPGATIMAAAGNLPWWKQPESIDSMLIPLPVKIFFWQTAWFQITFLTLSGFCLLIIVFLVVQLALHQKERWLLQRERARIAMDIHDDIGSRITQLVLTGEDVQEALPEDSTVRMQLGRIWDDARKVLSSIDEILWALNPRLDTLRDFADYICDYTQKYLAPSGIECVFEVDSQMKLAAADMPLRRSLLMAIKETLNNTVKYSGATELQLKIERQHQHLVVVVRDNGRGFDPAAIKPGRHGLGNLSRRMRELGGSCQISSQPGQGCRIEFRIPLKRPRRFSWFGK
jgi:signal transduction histidine kinase